MKKTALILEFALIVTSSTMDSKVLIPSDSQNISLAKYKQNIRKKVRLTFCPLMPARPGSPFSPRSP